MGAGEFCTLVTIDTGLMTTGEGSLLDVSGAGGNAAASDDCDSDRLGRNKLLNFEGISVESFGTWQSKEREIETCSLALRPCQEQSDDSAEKWPGLTPCSTCIVQYHMYLSAIRSAYLSGSTAEVESLKAKLAHS